MRRYAGWALVLALASVAPAGQVLAQAAPRSAQGDCTREVERRGYRVVSTGNFQQFKDGWQIDVRARDQSGRNVNGSCFVETRSGDVTLYGFGWGGGKPVDRFEFTCASPDHRYRECQLPVDGRARLVKRKSDAPCVEGRSWGQRRDRVWVDNGCRAMFEVVRGGGGGGGAGQQIDCRSQNDRYQECALRKGYEARIVRDYTGRCRKDSTWGTRPGVLWVTNGCQGRFQIVQAGASGGSGNDNSGQRQRAEVQCRNEASRQGLDVQYVSPATLQGSYWSAAVGGRLRGRSVQADCRYYPSGNRAEIRF